MHRLAGQRCGEATLFQSAHTISHDEQLLLRVYEEAILILFSPALMRHPRHLELISQHLGMKGLIRSRLARTVGSRCFSRQRAHLGRALKGLIPAQPQRITAMLVSIPAGRNAVTGEP